MLSIQRGYPDLKPCKSIKPVNVDLEVMTIEVVILSPEDFLTKRVQSENQTKGRSLRNVTH